MKKMLYIFITVIVLYLLVMIFFYLIQEKFLFHPVITSSSHTYHFNDHFEEKYFKTPQDGNIHSLHFKLENSKGLVLYFHGNAGNLEDWAWVYENFKDHAYDVLVIDYRKFGKSKGDWNEENFHTDAQYIYDQLKESYLESEIVIYGRSIGTGIATQLASKNNPKALVLETPYYNIEDLAKRMLPIFPVKYLLKYKFESNKHILNVETPIFILHGTNDNVVPYSSGKKLYDLVKDKAHFTSFDNGTHSNLVTFEKYHTLMTKILK